MIFGSQYGNRDWSGSRPSVIRSLPGSRLAYCPAGHFRLCKEQIVTPKPKMNAKMKLSPEVKLLQSEAHLREVRRTEAMWQSNSGPDRSTIEVAVELSITTTTTEAALTKAVEKAWCLRKPVQPATGNASAGRFLVTDFDCVIGDGHARADSAGHLSDLNAPRPIFWLACQGRCLVSWIPEPIIEPISLAIESNPEESIWWLDL